MKVSVYHTTYNELTGQKMGFEHVADIAFDDGSNIETALEDAWRRTNNIEGSWSMGPYYNVAEADWSQYPESYDKNSDYHPSVTVKRPLHERNGKTFGLRSSMVGDLFAVDDKDIYVVANFGFEKVDLHALIAAAAKVA